MLVFSQCSNHRFNFRTNLFPTSHSVCFNKRDTPPSKYNQVYFMYGIFNFCNLRSVLLHTAFAAKQPTRYGDRFSASQQMSAFVILRKMLYKFFLRRYWQWYMEQVATLSAVLSENLREVGDTRNVLKIIDLKDVIFSNVQMKATLHIYQIVRSFLSWLRDVWILDLWRWDR